MLCFRSQELVHVLSRQTDDILQIEFPSKMSASLPEDMCINCRDQRVILLTDLPHLNYKVLPLGIGTACWVYGIEKGNVAFVACKICCQEMNGTYVQLTQIVCDLKAFGNTIYEPQEGWFQDDLQTISEDQQSLAMSF